VKQIFTNGNSVTAVEVLNSESGQHEPLKGDYFFSTMPVQELIAGIAENVPEDVKVVAAGLIYRDFVYTGVLVKKIAIGSLKDNWIYIQEKNVKVARIQIYNNWGPYMVKDPGTVWLGLEYFCSKGDHIWNLGDEDVKKMAVEELIKMKLVQAEDVLDTTVRRMEKTYPSYAGSYDKFHIIREWLNRYTNLFLVGRNGMHKYNNADHPMLTAMTAVDNIIANTTNKQNIWDINTEQDYQE
jgi:protoporphyrinogen oxidase